MSVSVTVTVSGGGEPGFIVNAIVAPERMEALNRVMAERLSEELKAHFTEKNKEPNKMAAPKTNFWLDVAKATGVTSVKADGAVVSVAEERFRIHLFGGTIVPKNARALTIPLIKEARGMFARDYERTTGRNLFSIPGVNVLFERAGEQTTSSVFGDTTARRKASGARTSTIRLKARTPLRAVYALAKSAKIRRDPDAIPAMEKLAAALAEEGGDFLAREEKKGGAL